MKCIFGSSKERKYCFLELIFFFILLSIVVFIIWRSIVCVKCITNSLLLSQVIVTGKRVYTSNCDIQISILNSGPIGSFISQDLRCIQEQIKRFSWIQQASVRKQWPNKIKVHIIEYTPVAHWNYKYMITKDAVIFSIPEGYVNKEFFPFLFGPSGSECIVLKNYYVFNDILQFNGCRMQSVVMDYRYSWKIILDNGINLILGREDIVSRLRSFSKAYPIFLKKYTSKKNESIIYIDLRYKSGFSVKKLPVFQYKN